jgi:hypothetical protein
VVDKDDAVEVIERPEDETHHGERGRHSKYSKLIPGISCVR